MSEMDSSERRAMTATPRAIGEVNHADADAPALELASTTSGSSAAAPLPRAVEFGMGEWDSSLRRVLIVRTGAIGDVVNALTVAAALKAAPTPVKIGWLVHPLSAPLLEENPLVDLVIRVPRDEGLGGYRRAVRAARMVGWDLAIDLQRITKSAVLARRSGAPRVLGWDAHRAKEGSWLWVKERVPRSDKHKHMVEQYGDFARYLGLNPVAPYGLLRTRPDSVERWDWAAKEWCGEPVVVNVGASTVPKRWRPEAFGTVAAALEVMGYQVLFTGAGHDDLAFAEVALAEAARRGAKHVRSEVNMTSLSDLVELLGRARLFVGCDTGPMHMAVAARCPVVALFGEGDAGRTGPYGASAAGRTRVLYPSADGTPGPLSELGPARVIEAARDVLALG